MTLLNNSSILETTRLENEVHYLYKLLTVLSKTINIHDALYVSTWGEEWLKKEEESQISPWEGKTK